MLTVVDYGRGNLYSISQALRHLAISHTFGHTATDIERASHILLPGVGAFGDAMHTLRARGLIEPLRDVARSGRPFVGICLGMQLLATVGTEFGVHDGLDLIEGRVERLPANLGRVPNVGWRAISVRDTVRWVYFVHSYMLVPRDPSVVTASASFGAITFPAMVRSGSITGLQFHPEKSGRDGLALFAEALGADCSDRVVDPT